MKPGSIFKQKVFIASAFLIGGSLAVAIWFNLSRRRTNTQPSSLEVGHS